MNISPAPGPNSGSNWQASRPQPTYRPPEAASPETGHEPALLKELVSALRDARITATIAGADGTVDYPAALERYRGSLATFAEQLAGAALTPAQLGTALGKICDDLGFLINFSSIELALRKQFLALAESPRH